MLLLLGLVEGRRYKLMTVEKIHVDRLGSPYTIYILLIDDCCYIILFWGRDKHNLLVLLCLKYSHCYFVYYLMALAFLRMHCWDLLYIGNL